MTHPGLGCAAGGLGGCWRGAGKGFSREVVGWRAGGSGEVALLWAAGHGTCLLAKPAYPLKALERSVPVPWPVQDTGGSGMGYGLGGSIGSAALAGHDPALTSCDGPLFRSISMPTGPLLNTARSASLSSYLGGECSRWILGCSPRAAAQAS